jgi:hypothetical protein
MLRRHEEPLVPVDLWKAIEPLLPEEPPNRESAGHDRVFSTRAHDPTGHRRRMKTRVSIARWQKPFSEHAAYSGHVQVMPVTPFLAPTSHTAPTASNIR